MDDGVIKRASNKINALSRVTPFMNLSKKKMLLNSFFNLQFSYCPPVWTCYSRTINNKTNQLNERFLSVIYNDRISSFREPLERDWSVPIHNKNLQILATQIFKVYKYIAAWKVSKYGVFSDPYFPVFSSNTGKYGPEKPPYLDTFHAVYSSADIYWDF